VLFAELERNAAQAPSDVQARLAALTDELKAALVELSQEAQAEHLLRDFTDRAAVLWKVSALCATSQGSGSAADLRAARRLLSRSFPQSLLRKDRAGAADVRSVFRDA
jgi:hypothetical protein